MMYQVLSQGRYYWQVQILAIWRVHGFGGTNFGEFEPGYVTLNTKFSQITNIYNSHTKLYFVQ